MNMIQYLSLYNVSFSFGQGCSQFFDNIAIDFKVGQINFICGKNGMGKSTLLKILSGNIRSKNLQGILQIDQTLYDLQTFHDVNKPIAFVVQNFNTMLIDNYTFYKNLQFSLLSYYPSLNLLPMILPLPTFVENYKINLNIPIHLLSGGQRQILSILMVLQRSPKILLLDEPTASLDEENAKIVMNFLQDLCERENITIIAIVHHIEMVKKYAESSYFELYDDAGLRKIRSVLI